jgi:hypothetical protein
MIFSLPLVYMKYRIILFLVFSSFGLFATHNQAGVITWQHLGGYSYKIRITTLTEINSPGGNADRCKLSLYINGKDSMVMLRINGPNNNPTGDCVGTTEGVEMDATCKQNIYEGIYSFPCQGVFTLSCSDPNRNAGIVNIPNSVNQAMYFQSEIKVPLPTYACLQTSPEPQLVRRIIISNQPNQKFYALVFNPKDDSLVYNLVACQTTSAQNIPGYSFAGFTINAITGEVTSNNSTVGQYNICIKTKIYRKGEFIGSVNYDCSVYLLGTNYNPVIGGYSSNTSQTNGIYQLVAAQTLTLSGAIQNSVSAYFLFYSEITGPALTFSSNLTNFTISLTYSASLARDQPYQFVLSARNSQAPGGMNDTLIRVKILGGPTNTCSLMSVGAVTCNVSVKENHSDHFEFKLYPSITSNELHFEGQFKSLGIMDVSGKIVQPISIQNDQMNVENLSPGVYILMVTDLNNHHHYYKFVKN